MNASTNRRRLLAFVIAGAAAVLAFRSFSATAEDDSALAVTHLSVNVEKAEWVDSYEIERAYTGTVAARRTSEMGFTLGGIVQEMHVDEGAKVKAQQPLAQLKMARRNTLRRQAAAQRAEAAAVLAELESGPRFEAVSAARATVDDLKQQLELQAIKDARREKLVAVAAVSQEESDEAAFSREALTARLRAAQNRLDELENGTRSEQLDAQRARLELLDAQLATVDVDIALSTLRAPFDGSVTMRYVDEGTVVAAGQAIVRVVEDGALEAVVGVPATAAASITIGETMTVIVNEQEYAAEVDAVVRELDRATRTQTVRLRFTGTDLDRIVPGQVARLLVAERREGQGIWLPVSALVKADRGLWACYVAVAQPGDTHVIEERVIEILHAEAERAFVRGTLEAHELVVQGGVHRIVAGQKVQIEAKVVGADTTQEAFALFHAVRTKAAA